jgi:hypothetical protein
MTFTLLSGFGAGHASRWGSGAFDTAQLMNGVSGWKLLARPLY